MYLKCLLLILSLVQIHAKVTVSGLSSGGAMAVQFHIAHSSVVKGAAIVAGAPYYCAHDSIDKAHTHMQNPDLIDLDDLYTETTKAHSAGSIDPLSHLNSSKVYLYSGTQDSVVNPGAMLKTQQYYQNYVPTSSIKSVFNISSEHGFITTNFGNTCSTAGSPFLNNCNYDQAGDILDYFYGPLHRAVSPKNSSIISLSQATFAPQTGLDAASLDDNAYLYVPEGCSGCDVHIAFHGCDQLISSIGTTFVKHAGFNGWAEANKIVIIYPQAKKTTTNPKGCWDWWGYTGTGYASQSAAQITTIQKYVGLRHW
eukprot:Phypoly_transcript_14469.p1 GENE.Phypoly_transcript_14469~~Phypoly_transcript_14469.p1  ORF type:complete len:311 (+),score=43.76 Phypoly_transcript_14469:48-980(+)